MANDDYSWQLEVNIVKVTIAAPDDGAFKMHNVASKVSVPITDGGSKVFPGPNRPNFFGLLLSTHSEVNEIGTQAENGYSPFDYRAKVTLQGPATTLDDGDVRKGKKGLDWIEVGFVQAVSRFYAAAFYASDPALGDENEGDKWLEFGFAVDSIPVIDTSANNGKVPWYSHLLNQSFHLGRTGSEATIGSRDAPEIIVPLTLDKGGTVDPSTDQILDKVRWEIAFQLDVGVRAIGRGGTLLDPTFEQLTRRATTNWTVNGNGTVDNTTFAWSAADGAGVFHVNEDGQATDAWRFLEDGSAPLVTNGPPGHELIKNATWNPK